MRRNAAFFMDILAEIGHIGTRDGQIGTCWKGKGVWHGICTYMGETQLRKIRQQRTLRKLR